MNLIEQLGGYNNAKHWDKNRAVGSILSGIYHDILSLEFIEYRRENNIFEVGDIVVGRCYSDFDDALLTVTKKFTHDGKPCVVFECTRTICDDFESEVRHATDDEIKVGHRI